jgi:flagellar biosynthesis protein FliR
MLFRIGSMLMVMPFYGYTTIPMLAKMGLAIIITSLLFSVHTDIQVVLAGNGVIEFFGIVAREIVIGLSIGLISVFLFYGFQFGGHVMSQSMGFSMINIIDPQSQTNIPLIGQMLNLLALMLFVLADGHHFLLYAIDESFVAIPIGAGGFSGAMVEGYARLSADIFVIGVKIGAPVLVAIIVTEMGLGFLARTVPQMNVWLIGFPLKIGIGLLTMGLSLPMFVYVFGKYYGGWQSSLIGFIRAVALG